jgi:transposase
MESYAALVAFDWSDTKHDGAVLPRGEQTPERFILTQRPESIEAWALSLRARFNGSPVAVILEQSKGALIHALLKYDFLVLYPVHPATLARYREAFAPSGAKDDPTDTQLLLEILQRHPERLKRWDPDSTQTRILQYLVETRRTLVNDRKRLGNRLTSLLKGYFPQVLELFPKMGRKILSDFVIAYPTLEAAQAAPDEELHAFFRSHCSGYRVLLERRVALIRAALPLTNDAAILNTAPLLAKALAEQMNALVALIEEFDRKIDAVFSSHPDAPIFASLPAAGECLAPRLLSAFGSKRERFSCADEFERFSGIAPVIERSGKHCWVRWRYNCNKFLRQSIQEWAGVTIKYSLWARAYYAMQRAKGKPHPTAVRALAYKWIRILFRLWKDSSRYSEIKYIESLQRSGSPIIKFMAEHRLPA